MQLLLSTICLGLTSAVIGNAWYQKKQFYPAVVYITKSNASMAVIYIQFFTIVFMFGKLLRKIFLGTLRAAEFEHLLERFWYAITETCLAFTVFRDDFNPRFVALFTVLLFVKSFHWLAEERVDFMERSPVLGWLFHIRITSLLAVLGTLDYILLMHAYSSTLASGPTVQLVFGFEYAILLTVVASTAIKYVLHAAEMRTDTPWENKAVILLYTELFIGLIKVILYVVFVVIMVKFYALPMFVFRPMFFTIRNFKKALSDVIMSRLAIRNMNTLYPDATPEELRLSDNICIICREDMVNHSKKLPCGHIFHTICLRSWFQRQQTCPTCRLDILRTPTTNSTALPRADDNPNANGAAGGAAAAAANTGPIANPADARNGQNPSNIFEQLGLPNAPLNIAGPGGSGLPNFSGLPMMPTPFMMPPPFPFIAPYAVPPPPMPPDLTNLTDEELRTLEGNERKNIEERLKLLRNIQLMLDAANVLMNNYQLVASRTQSLNPTPSTAGPVPTEPASSNEPTTPASSSETVSNISSKSNAKSDDLPSTSAAAASLNTSKDEVSKEEGEDEVSDTAKQNNAAEIPVAKHNQVTIEDLDSEDHVDVQTPTTSSVIPTVAATSSTTSIGHTTDHINELRKRRLKFLEERNKTSNE